MSDYTLSQLLHNVTRSDPVGWLRAVVQLPERAEDVLNELQEQAVDAAKANDASWEQIGRALGVNRATAYRQYSHVVGPQRRARKRHAYVVAAGSPSPAAPGGRGEPLAVSAARQQSRRPRVSRAGPRRSIAAAIGSAGTAPALQAGGRSFDPSTAHSRLDAMPKQTRWSPPRGLDVALVDRA